MRVDESLTKACAPSDVRADEQHRHVGGSNGRFTVRIPGHRQASVPAKTCSRCGGLGYVTGKPQRIMVTKFGNPPVTKAMVANPGDPCLTCCGRGWIGLIASAPARASADPRPRVRRAGRPLR